MLPFIIDAPFEIKIKFRNRSSHICPNCLTLIKHGYCRGRAIAALVNGENADVNNWSLIVAN